MKIDNLKNKNQMMFFSVWNCIAMLKRTLYFEYKNISEIKQLIKHLQGQHDQRLHGNRFGKVGTDPKTLIHHGGGAPGKNVIYDDQGNPVAVRLKKPGKVQKISNDEINKNNQFPTQAELDSAKLNKFYSNGVNSVYSFTVGEKKFFAKEMTWENSKGSESCEILASKYAKDIGIENYTIPITMMKKNNTNLLVEPWTDMKPIGNFGVGTMRAAAKSLSLEDYTKLFAYQYITNSNDSHAGNVLIDPATNAMKVIDMGYTFDHAFWRGDYNPKDSIIDSMRSQALNLSNTGDLSLDKNTLKKIYQKSKHLLSDMKNAGIPDERILAAKNRMETINGFASSDKTATIKGIEQYKKEQA
jgi:hypothetical protein